MIAKGELENLKEIHPLIKDYVDEWVVVVPPGDSAIDFLKEKKAKVIVQDFTQGIEPEIVDKFRDYGLDIDADYRLFNFAAARNKSLGEATGDYVMWLDGDDRPVGMEKVREFITSQPRTDVLEAVYDYARDDEGNPISDHIRERIFKNNGRWIWKGAELGLIHETLLPEEGFNPFILQLSKKDFYVKHVSKHADQSSERNFVALLYEYIKTDGKDPRTIYYLGTEFFNHKMYKECIQIMADYIKVGGWDEERYRAWLRIGESFHMLGNKESSRNAFLNATKELPAYPDAYLAIGESYHSSGEWQKAIEFLTTGLQKPLPKTKSAVDPVRLMFRPAGFLALSYHMIGDQDKAYYWFDKARKMNPKDPWVNQYAELFEEVKELRDYVKAFVTIGQLSQRKYRKTLSKLADAIPEELMNQELLLDFKRRYTTPKIWGDKTIAFWCSSAFEEWGPDSLKTGTGGSEEAIIQLAPRLVKLGWDVTVFNNCPKEEVRDGVKWVRFEKFNPRDLFNILIGWRNNPYLEPKVASKKYIDMHDIPTSYFAKDMLKGIKLFVKSEYHKSLFKGLDDDQFVVIPNGIDTKQFSNPEKTKNNLVWTSSYDRGLEYLLDMWADIRKEVPDVTLDVAYGFDLFDESARGQTDEGRTWKAKVTKMLDQEGIVHHGRLNSEDVAKLYNKAEVWAYPTDFPEICCITATKSMAAGAIPVTTDYAVLKERNQGILVKGSGADPKVQQKFKEELISLLKDDKRKEEIRSKMDVSTYDWDIIAGRWDEELK